MCDASVAMMFVLEARDKYRECDIFLAVERDYGGYWCRKRVVIPSRGAMAVEKEPAREPHYQTPERALVGGLADTRAWLDVNASELPKRKKR